MKRLSYFLSALALVVLMQGCGNGPVPEPELPDNPDSPSQTAVQMHLKGSVAKPTTRMNDTGFTANDKVGIYASKSNSLAGSGNILNNEAFTYDASGNITAPEGKEIFWNSEEDRLSVWAYYPYSESVSNPAAYPFAVAADQSEIADYFNSVFITARATDLAPQTNAVNLTFNHALSKLDIIISSEDELATDKVFTIDGLVVDGSIDIASGTATAGTTTATITPLANSSNTHYSAIVYPQESVVTFNMVINGQEFRYTTDEIELEAGYQYAYTLIIDIDNPQQISLSTNSIIPWEDGESHTGTMSDIITFADAKFKEYLVQEDLHINVSFNPESGFDYSITNGKIDANSDGEISIAEAKRVEYIKVPKDMGITDISDLPYFPNLKILLCGNIGLTSLDISKNTALLWLNSDLNALTSLDVSNNTALIYLDCRDNQITSLDVSKNTALYRLSCYGNELTSLDVSKNTALTNLHCATNNLTTLDISKNTALTQLQCHNNQLTSLDISKNTALKYLSCSNNQLTTLDTSKNLSLTNINCSRNQISALDVTKNTELKSLTCESNEQLTSLDVTKNTKLTYLGCTYCPIEVLDVTQNTALESLYCRCPLSTLDLSNCTALQYFDCLGSRLTSLDFSGLTALKRIMCSDNGDLTTINLSNCTALEELYCGGCKLTTIDASDSPALKKLECSPQYDENDNNCLTTLYLANGVNSETFNIPGNTVVEYK